MARTATLAASKETSVADLAAEIQTLRDDLGSLTGTLSELTKVKGHEVTHLAAQKADAVQQKATEVAGFVSARAKDAQDQAEDFVQKQPATALGIAAGVGFLVGMMSARR